MRLARDGLQKVAAGQLRVILGLLTRNRFLGVFVGIVMTVLMQSSSATTVMLVSFVDAGLMDLFRTLGVILGAGIGTTVTIQIIAFNVTDFALLVFAVGLMLFLLAKYEKGKYLGYIFMGFGLIFYGMVVMREGVVPLKDNPRFVGLLFSFAEKPLWGPLLGLFVATVFTGIIQSSAATIALALSFASQSLPDGTPLLSLEVAVPIIFGANIGTCATALLSSVGTNVNARRVAIAHLFFKVGAVLIFFPFIKPFCAFTRGLTAFIVSQPSPVRLIANAHTFFNLLNTGIFIGFTAFIGRFIERLVPERKRAVEEIRYLDPRLLDTPAFALERAKKETLRMAGVIEGMLKAAIRVVREDDHRLLEDTCRQDDKVDYLNEEITAYLTQLSRKTLTGKEAEEEVALLHVAANLEGIGDLISKDLLTLARKKIEEGTSFSFEGLHEIGELHQKVASNLSRAIEAFTKDDFRRAGEVVDAGGKITAYKLKLHTSHIDRLHKRLPETLESGSVYLDMLSTLEQISYYTASIARVLLGKQE